MWTLEPPPARLQHINCAGSAGSCHFPHMQSIDWSCMNSMQTGTMPSLYRTASTKSQFSIRKSGRAGSTVSHAPAPGPLADSSRRCPTSERR